MRSVLLVDDEANLRTLVHETLDDGSYSIVEAADGLAALAAAVEHQPDLVILDWMMPGRSGVEVTEDLRRNPRTSKAKIVLLSARSQEKDRKLALSAGADAYIAKPFSPIELLNTVDKLLEDPCRQ